MRLDRAALHASVSDPCLESMNFLNEITMRYPDAISFGPGRPYDGFYEIADIRRNLDAYVTHLREAEGREERAIVRALFQYGATAGQIRELVARMLRRDEGIDVDPAALVVTVGCQEAMLIVLRALFADPDQVLLVTEPCYVGIVGAARLLGLEVVGVREAGGGPDPADLAAKLAALRARGKRARAFYVNPDFANPSGLTMSVEERRALLDAAEAEELVLLEDNAYGLFTAPGTRLPTLKSLDTGGRVVYLGSFSKSAFPGVRVGFAIADQPVDGPGGTGLLADELSKIKSMVTVNTPALCQAVVGGLLVRHADNIEAANAKSIGWYETNRATLLDALAEAFPEEAGWAAEVRWNRPRGGFFLTVDVPFAADAEALAVSAGTHGVIWTPMSSFYLGAGGERQLRLSYSYLTPDQIREGVHRLAGFVRDRIEGGAGAARPLSTAAIAE
ncbi:MAG: PLP-dependent aminotransferase family protein [Azospirillaceae bacterium]